MLISKDQRRSGALMLEILQQTTICRAGRSGKFTHGDLIQAAINAQAAEYEKDAAKIRATAAHAAVVALSLILDREAAHDEPQAKPPRGAIIGAMQPPARRAPSILSARFERDAIVRAVSALDEGGGL